MPRSQILGCLLLFALSSTRPLLAGLGRWTTTGPEGGAALAILVPSGRPETILAGFEGGGVFESTDAGAHWRYLGLAGANVRALASDPADPETLYAGSDSGFFRSGDGGLSWQYRTDGLPALPILSIAVDPRSPSTLYAGLFQSSYPGYRGGVFRSTDRGETWAARGLGGGVRSVIVDVNDPETLYALTLSRYFQTLVTSHDGGETWSETLGSESAGGSVTALALDASNPGTLFAGVWSVTTFNGRVFKSADGGTGWVPISGELGAGGIYSLLVDQRDPATIYASMDAGIFQTVDNGSTWRLVREGSIVSIADDPELGLVYGVGPEGISRSSDRGVTWSTSISGLTATQISGLFRTNSGDLYATADGSLFHTADHGEHWLAERPLPPGTFGFAVDPANTSIRYAGIVESGLCRGVSKSMDGGVSWIPTSLTVGCIARFEFDPHISVVYAVGQFGLWKSADAGATWTSTSPGDPVTALAIHPLFPMTLFAGTFQRGIFRSTDGGASWQPANNGIPDSRSGCASDGTQCPKQTITSLALDPRDPKTMFAGTFEPPILDPSNSSPGISGLSKTIDGGETWTTVGAGIAGTAQVVLAIDASDPTKIYAGTDRGVFRSIDAGRTFAPLGEGLTHPVVSALHIDSTGRFLDAATRGGGVFDIELLPDRALPILVPPRVSPREVVRPANP